MIFPLMFYFGHFRDQQFIDNNIVEACIVDYDPLGMAYIRE
jgi:hypothetical protein